MCYVAAIPYIISAVGAAATMAGQQQQQREFRRAQSEQEAFNETQRQMALTQRAEDRKFSDQKQASILNEAATVAPTRTAQIQQAEDKQTASNVNALQQANLLGDDSVAAGAAGNQSNEYVKARAQAAAKQTDQAIKLARLFGAQGAGNDAVANQALGAIDHRLDQQALDARRRSMHQGYDWLFDDLAVRREKANGNYNPHKGAGLQALGGLAMNYGMGQMGSQAGSYFGKQAGNAQIINNLM